MGAVNVARLDARDRCIVGLCARFRGLRQGGEATCPCVREWDSHEGADAKGGE
jgi:hypothetical protein